MKKSLKTLNENSRKKTESGSTSAADLALDLARLIDEKKGSQIIVFDLRDMSPITDFFVIANGLSEIHARSIAESLVEFAKPVHVEGYNAGTWILLDYVDVIVHLFIEETRQFYGLERLWGDAQEVDFGND